MAASIFWRCLGVLAVLVLVGWVVCKVFDRTTVDLKVHYGASAPTAQTAPADPPATAPATSGKPTPVAPATPPQVSSDTKLIMEAMERMDLRQQGRDANQDQRLDEFGHRLDALSPGTSSPPPAGCPAGCISDVQHVTPRRN